MYQLAEHIFLIGFMGVGKTSTARNLSRQLGVREYDTDRLIVQQQEREISAIFAQQGEEAFRQMETDLLDELKSYSPSIIACGGGMVLREENVRKMKEQGKILLLLAAPETIYEHVKDSTNRPLLAGRMNVGAIAELMGEREPRYQAAADLKVETDGMIPREVAEKVIGILRENGSVTVS